VFMQYTVYEYICHNFMSAIYSGHTQICI